MRANANVWRTNTVMLVGRRLYVALAKVLQELTDAVTQLSAAVVGTW